MANTTNFAVEKPTVGGYRKSWGGTLNVALDKLTELLALALPIGTIQIYTQATAPTATTNGGTWLVCDGSTKVRTDYPELHTLITNTYGAYPSGSTFVLPDLRTRVPLGYSASTIGSGDAQRTPKAIAATGGEEKHTLTEAELDEHTHALPNTSHTHGITEPNSGAGHTHTGANSGGTANAATGITSPAHSHQIERYHQASGSAVHKVQINYLSQGELHSTYASSSDAVTINDPEHKHDFTTTSAVSGVTVNQAVTGITATNNTGSSTAHENLPPYQVLNYIILAKHPTF